MIPAAVCALVFILMTVNGYVYTADVRRGLLVEIAIALMLCVLLTMVIDNDMLRLWQAAAYLLSFLLGSVAGVVWAHATGHDNRS